LSAPAHVARQARVQTSPPASLGFIGMRIIGEVHSKKYCTVYKKPSHKNIYEQKFLFVNC
jgi:hypothetical protein